MATRSPNAIQNKTNDALGKTPGIYALVLKIDTPCTLRIGRFGRFTFQAGIYLYLGSARGPGGVVARVHRHLQDEMTKRKHWHIDWLRQAAGPVGVIWTHTKQADECEWAQALSSKGSREPDGFGASDCGCEGHLVRLETSLPWQRCIALLETLDGERPLHTNL
jgi:Uri superfamily endonuclease